MHFVSFVPLHFFSGAFLLGMCGLGCKCLDIISLVSHLQENYAMQAIHPNTSKWQIRLRD